MGNSERISGRRCDARKGETRLCGYRHATGNPLGVGDVGSAKRDACGLPKADDANGGGVSRDGGSVQDRECASAHARELALATVVSRDQATARRGQVRKAISYCL